MPERYSKIPPLTTAAPAAVLRFDGGDDEKEYAGWHFNPNPDIEPASGPSAETEYKVGPGRPPKEYQFKPGQSGNPTGAKRKPPSLVPVAKKIFDGAFSQKVTVKAGGRELAMTAWAAGTQKLAAQFARGDRHARRDAFVLAEKLGSEFLKPAKSSGGALDTVRQALLDAYVDRRTSAPDCSAPSPVLAPSELRDDDNTPDQVDKPVRK